MIKNSYRFIKKMMKYILFLLTNLLRIILTPLILFDKRKLCVIYIDGGLGSQINKLAIGLNMEAHGYTVKYDLSPFKNGQKDINNKYNRNFDLNKVYKGCIREASKLDILYSKNNNKYKSKNLFAYDNNLFIQKTPVYIDGYIDNIKYWNDVKKLLHNKCNFEMNLNQQNMTLLNEMRQRNNSVVIHVRRGDYSNSIFDVTTIKYFNSAILKMNEKIKDPVFYFFSNDPKWIRDVLLTQLPLRINSIVVDFNDNDSGFADIALMSSAKNFILSNSGFSVMGAFFSKNEDKCIIMPNKWFKDRQTWLFDKSMSDEEISLETQKAHDITGKTIFLPC